VRLLFLFLGGLYFGNNVGFNISGNSFRRCSSEGYGGAVYTTSTVGGIRHLIDLEFDNNTGGDNKGW
jgi:hypothetical protein